MEATKNELGLSDFSEAERAEIRRWMEDKRASAPPPPDAFRHNGVWLSERIKRLAEGNRGTFPRGIPWVVPNEDAKWLGSSRDPVPLLQASDREKYFAQVDAERAEKNRKIEAEAARQKKSSEDDYRRKTGTYSQYVGLGETDLHGIRPQAL